jgi:hypothetical protein
LDDPTAPMGANGANRLVLQPLFYALMRPAGDEHRNTGSGATRSASRVYVSLTSGFCWPGLLLLVQIDALIVLAHDAGADLRR